MSDTERRHPVLLRAVQCAVGVLMIFATLLNFANIVGRYVFGRPIVWAEEVMQLVNVWAVLLGAAIVTRHGTHIQMDFFYNLLPRRGRRVLQGFFGLITLGVALYVIAQSLRMIGMLGATGQRTVIARVPMAAAYVAVPLGFLLTIVFLPIWSRTWMRRIEPSPETTTVESAVAGEPARSAAEP